MITQKIRWLPSFEAAAVSAAVVQAECSTTTLESTTTRTAAAAAAVHARTGAAANTAAAGTAAAGTAAAGGQRLGASGADEVRPATNQSRPQTRTGDRHRFRFDVRMVRSTKYLYPSTRTRQARMHAPKEEDALAHPPTQKGTRS